MARCRGNYPNLADWTLQDTYFWFTEIWHRRLRFGLILSTPVSANMALESIFKIYRGDIREGTQVFSIVPVSAPVVAETNVISMLKFCLLPIKVLHRLLADGMGIRYIVTIQTAIHFRNHHIPHLHRYHQNAPIAWASNSWNIAKKTSSNVRPGFRPAFPGMNVKSPLWLRYRPIRRCNNNYNSSQRNYSRSVKPRACGSIHGPREHYQVRLLRVVIACTEWISSARNRSLSYHTN